MNLTKIDPDKIARQQGNAAAAFERASGQLVFRIGKDFVQGASKQARAALKSVAGPNDTKRAFIAAFIAVCKQNGLTPQTEGARGASFITIDMPRNQKK